jgi:rhomboid domain-containing protein 1
MQYRSKINCRFFAYTSEFYISTIVKNHSYGYRLSQDGDLRRFFLSAFYHGNEVHFFTNMVSLLRTGIELETSMGSLEFGFMVATLLGLSQGFTLLLCKGLLLLGNGRAYYHQYSAGFSGVLFGMSAVRQAWAGDVELPGVLRVPAKYVVWVQLLLVQVTIPQAYFIGHLGGILAGLTYLRLCSGAAGPIALLTWGIANVASRSVRFARRLVSSAARPGHRCAAPAPRETGRGMWRCSACCNDNSRCADVCEACSTPHENRAFCRRRHL